MGKKKSGGPARKATRPAAKKPAKKPVAAVKKPKGTGTKSGSTAPTLAKLRRLRTRDEERLAAERKAVERELKRVKKKLFARGDVTGVHVGFKETNGVVEVPLRYALCIHVAVKRKLTDVKLKKPIDATEFGVPIDVQEFDFEPVQHSCDDVDGIPEPHRRRSKIVGGIAVANDDSRSNWGTVGIVAFRGGSPFYLTNKHVAGKKNDAIVQPPFGECAEQIGTVTAAAISTSVDCALIQAGASRPAGKGVLGIAGKILPDAGELVPADEGVTEVVKVGAKTGLTRGVVRSIHCDFETARQSFARQILIESRSGAIIGSGDSGSVLLKKKSLPDGSVAYQVVGLVHAQTPSRTGIVASHIKRVSAMLGGNLKFD